MKANKEKKKKKKGGINFGGVVDIDDGGEGAEHEAAEDGGWRPGEKGPTKKKMRKTGFQDIKGDTANALASMKNEDDDDDDSGNAKPKKKKGGINFGGVVDIEDGHEEEAAEDGGWKPGQ